MTFRFQRIPLSLHTLPQSIKAGYLNIPVEPYVPNPLCCFKCKQYGHEQNTCRNKMTCARCGQIDHDSKSCNNYTMCELQCKPFCIFERECPRWKVEKRFSSCLIQILHSLSYNYIYIYEVLHFQTLLTI